MLQAIRSKATSFVVKILFGLLIVTFGVWGIGDIFRNRAPDTTVATVGGRTITADQLSQAVQNQIEQLRSTIGSIDLAQAKQLGVVDDALQKLINTDLVDLEMERMGLAIGDQAVRDAIFKNPAFHGANGQFDRNTYIQLLAANHMTEAQYEAGLRTDMLREQMISALVTGMLPPDELVTTLYRARNESRVADFVLLPADAGGAIGKPTEDQVAAYYKAHGDQFRAPERRSFKVAMLRLDDLAAGIELTNDQLQQEYKKRLDEFSTPETRHVMQILFSDEATAKEAETQLAAGKDFAAVAKDVAKTDDPASLDLGWVSRDDLPKELADPVFALKEGETTQPIKSTFGWHVLRVIGDKPATQQSFDEVKDKLATEVKHDRASDRISDVANQIDDAIAGGATLDAIVQKFGLKTATLDDVDSEGKGADGKSADLPQPSDTILHAAFSTDSGQTSSLTEMGNDGYFLVHVDKVTPAAVRPLAEVHDKVAEAWQDEERKAALSKVAEGMVAEVKAGKSLKDVAAAHGLVARTSTPVQRSGGDARLPPTLIARLFDLKPGEAVYDGSSDNIVVAQLDSVQPADPAKNPAAVRKLATDLENAMENDLISEFDQGLRRTFPVDVQQSNVDRLF